MIHLLGLAALLLQQVAEPPTPANLDQWLQEVREASFPELVASPLSVKRFTSDTVFFMSNFDVVAALDDAQPLQLHLLINDAVLDDGPGEGAIRAILAHELAHSLDYVQRRHSDGRHGLLALVPMLVWPPAEAEVERRTDLVAVERGYARGLIAYRLWLYRRLSPRAVQEKRRVYYAPIELDLLERLARQCPDAMAAAIANPPLDAAGIARLGPSLCFR